jgi:hypothetical protein
MIVISPVVGVVTNNHITTTDIVTISGKDLDVG